MFVRLYDLYWSRESLISRLRARYAPWHGEQNVLYGHRLSKDGKQILPERRNLVIELCKDGEPVSVTVTPGLNADADNILVMVPLPLVKHQLQPVQGTDQKCLWHAETKKVLVFKQEEHIAFFITSPYDEKKEALLHFLVDVAFEQGDCEEDEEEEEDVMVVGETPAREVVYLGESRDGHDVTRV